jgi:hypothetical protein
VPKTVKGTSARKPPEPSADHSDIEDWFGRLMPNLQPIVRDLDKSIRAAVPNLQFAVKYRRAFYGLPKHGWLIELAPYDVSVNVLFFGGADFKPPPPLGSTDRTRYVKVTSLDEAQDAQLQKWMKQAGRTTGWQ